MYPTTTYQGLYPTARYDAWGNAQTQQNALAIRHGDTTLFATGESAVVFSIGVAIGALAVVALLSRN